MSGIRFLLDTNYIIGLVKQQAAVTQEIIDRAIVVQACAYSAITRIELLGFPDITPQEVEGIERILAPMYYAALTREIEDCTIVVRRQYCLKTPDAIIAATAKCLKLELLTLDQQLIKRMQEIEVSDLEG
ncbi:PIN domain-containing protein [Cyanobacteria bacterium FACHB-DQ100]|nr:PIN domain-containing protein [Cyanobacteria bacterium FACHB-DQ100]